VKIPIAYIPIFGILFPDYMSNLEKKLEQTEGVFTFQLIKNLYLNSVHSLPLLKAQRVQ